MVAAKLDALAISAGVLNPRALANAAAHIHAIGYRGSAHAA
jgi:hypothetical protein